MNVISPRGGGPAGAPVRAFLPQAGHCYGGPINIYSSQLGREMSGRAERAIVTERSETLTRQQGPSFPTDTHSHNTRKKSSPSSVLVWAEVMASVDDQECGSRQKHVEKTHYYQSPHEGRRSLGAKGKWRISLFSCSLHEKPPMELTRRSAKRIRQCWVRERSSGFMNTRPSRLDLPLWPLFNQRNLIAS